MATSSTTVELVAIEKALNAAAELPPQQIVILSDSKCALQRLVNPSFSDPLTTAVRNTVGELENQDTAVYLQWIPGHVGVKGNDSQKDCQHHHTGGPTKNDPRCAVARTKRETRTGLAQRDTGWVLTSSVDPPDDENDDAQVVDQRAEEVCQLARLLIQDQQRVDAGRYNLRRWNVHFCSPETGCGCGRPSVAAASGRNC
ncbi:hypothetical protein HPB47_008055 [Ixodes persulcatus]|uniref:Uncharacterized protein n=1 Tax=Ixodes persulcatus TaxID=34615 RepID=A0AC60P5T1_IXOPE|nr:hypothetical protein HPB47_008055 [Ixodes persulcatus]